MALLCAPGQNSWPELCLQFLSVDTKSLLSEFSTNDFLEIFVFSPVWCTAEVGCSRFLCWWTQVEALGKLLIQELWTSIPWIILLALKAVVTTNNYTHSSGFMLATLAVNNPSLVTVHATIPLNVRNVRNFPWSVRNVLGDVVQLSHEWNWGRFPPLPTWKDLANSMETSWRYKTAPRVVWSIPW